jgi:hypothetical protein
LIDETKLEQPEEKEDGSEDLELEEMLRAEKASMDKDLQVDLKGENQLPEFGDLLDEDIEDYPPMKPGAFTRQSNSIPVV